MNPSSRRIRNLQMAGQIAFAGSAMPSIAIPAVQGELMEYHLSEQENVEEEPVPEGPLGSVLEIRYLNEVLDPFKGEWLIKPAPPTDESSGGKNDASKYSTYAFNVIRKFSPSADPRANMYNVTTTLQINSPELIKVGKEAIGQAQGISWTAKPLRIDPQILLGWLPEFEAYAKKLEEEVQSAAPDSPLHTTHKHLTHLLTYLTTTHADTLDTLHSLLAHGEITFELLWALFIPQKTILYTLCPITGEPRALRLVHAEICQKLDQGSAPFADPASLVLGGVRGQNAPQLMWRLMAEYVEADVGTVPGEALGELGSGGSKVNTDAGPTQFGYGPLTAALDVLSFKGAKKISSLHVYPIQYYKGPGGPEGLKDRLVERGRKWVQLAGGMHHLSYRGVASRWKQMGYVKHSVNSRVMIDRRTFVEAVPNYAKFPIVTKTLSSEDIDRHALRTMVKGQPDATPPDSRELTDEELMLTTPIVYGFSFADKQWLEFAVDFVEPFQWNDDAFSNLVLPTEQKQILRTLVESHNTGAASKFDDFVSGKGVGLVINLFGNPGTGKSLTAEAMSEYVRKPLYVVGAADLGTSAELLDANLTNVLKISATWGAVVLIDEADVFLEERSLQHLERNAMVAVFLRQLEYFRGILFLTTNRVRVFDEAFQSRIHISLRYHDLSPDAKKQIWIAFMKKVNGNIPNGGLSADELRELGEKKVNGRQIKNVVKTAGALTVTSGEELGYKHLIRVLNLMEQFDVSHAMYQ